MDDAPVPERPSLPKLRAALPDVQVRRHRREVVDERRPAGPAVMFVGEQPGDREPAAA